MPAADQEMRKPFSMLSPRQKEILRLLLRGHDAKSVARLLGISTHTVNEHLRDARRNLRVSSSREAARILFEEEKSLPKIVGDEFIGVASLSGLAANAGRAGKSSSWTYFWGAIIVIGIAILVIALSSAQESRRVDRTALFAQPKVVATSPSAGAKTKPGEFLLRVTFDRPMLDGSYSFVQTSKDSYPDCELLPAISRDGRTFTMRCTARPGRRYEIWFNRPPFMNFKSTAGVPAEPFQLRFNTSEQ